MLLLNYVQYNMFGFKKFSFSKNLQHGGQSLVWILSILSDDGLVVDHGLTFKKFPTWQTQSRDE